MWFYASPQAIGVQFGSLNVGVKRGEFPNLLSLLILLSCTPYDQADAFLVDR